MVKTKANDSLELRLDTLLDEEGQYKQRAFELIEVEEREDRKGTGIFMVVREEGTKNMDDNTLQDKKEDNGILFPYAMNIIRLIIEIVIHSLLSLLLWNIFGNGTDPKWWIVICIDFGLIIIECLAYWALKKFVT